MLTLKDVKPLLEQHNKPMLSLYLRVDPTLPENQSVTPAWRIWLKTALKDIETCTPNDLSDVWTDIRAKTEQFLSPYTPQCKTLALFYGQDFEQVYKLPVALNNYAAFGKPALAGLLRAIDECKPYLLTFATHNTARFFIMSGEGLQHYQEIALDIQPEQWHELPLMPATAAGGLVRAGSHRDRFDDRMDEQVNRFYRKVAEEARKLSETYAVEQVVLGGNEEVAHAIQSYLTGIAIIGPIAIAQYLSSIEIVRRVAPLVSQFRLEQDLSLVQDVIQLDQAHGRAAVGKDVVHALKRQMVELLILPLDSTGEPLANELALEALLTGTHIKFVTGTAAEILINEFGAVARLYYKTTGD